MGRATDLNFLFTKTSKIKSISAVEGSRGRRPSVMGKERPVSPDHALDCPDFLLGFMLCSECIGEVESTRRSWHSEERERTQPVLRGERAISSIGRLFTNSRSASRTEIAAPRRRLRSRLRTPLVSLQSSPTRCPLTLPLPPTTTTGDNTPSVTPLHLTKTDCVRPEVAEGLGWASGS